MLSVQDHPLVLNVDNKINCLEEGLTKLQIQRIQLTKSLLKSTLEYALIICKNLNIKLTDRSIAILCGYEFLTNQQMVEQWLLEQLVENNECRFNCPLFDLQNKLLMKLNSYQQDFSCH